MELETKRLWSTLEEYEHLVRGEEYLEEVFKGPLYLDFVKVQKSPLTGAIPKTVIHAKASAAFQRKDARAGVLNESWENIYRLILALARVQV